MGGSVGWDGDLRQVTINHGNTHILLTIDSPTAYVNGAAVVLDVPPQIVNSLTKIPVRFVGESLGLDVDFHYNGFVVLVTAPTVAAPPAAVVEQPTQPAPLPDPAPADPVDAPAETPAAPQAFRLNDTIQLSNATLRVTNFTAGDHIPFEGIHAADGHYFLGVHFEVTAFSLAYGNTLWLPNSFVLNAVAASGVVFEQPLSVGEVSFGANETVSAVIYIQVPNAESITHIGVSDGANDTAIVYLR